MFNDPTPTERGTGSARDAMNEIGAYGDLIVAALTVAAARAEGLAKGPADVNQ